MRTVLIILTIILTSCSSENEIDLYLNEIDIKLKDKYEILSSESSIAIGDAVANFKFKVSDNDYNRIIEIIKNTRGFEIVKTDQGPLRNSAGLNPHIQKFAWTRDGMYVYEITIQDTIGSGCENYFLSLHKDNIVYLNYGDD